MPENYRACRREGCMRFALLGAAGYVAPRHIKAIHETGHELVAVMDPHDAVGRLDAHFPECAYFREFEVFDRFIEKERRAGRPIEWLSVCTPNYLHEAHVRWGLRMGMDVVCEKPLCLKPKNIAAIEALEEETGKRVWSMLQLRHSEEMIRLRGERLGAVKGDVMYWAPRGVWYQYSWKGDERKSGGLLANIGVHYFDMAIWLFGPVVQLEVFHSDPAHWTGVFFHERGARFEWSLATRAPYSRAVVIDGTLHEFANFKESDLHTEAYRAIFRGEGTPISEARKSLELIERIRQVARRDAA